MYGWEAWGNPTPWLNSDEYERDSALAGGGINRPRGRRTVPYAFDSLYAYMVAPAWWLHDISRAYGVAKAIGVASMTAVVFPTYLLARMTVSRGWAMFAAAGAAMIPALAYSSMLLLEPVAYPWAALCFYLVAKALVTRRPAWIAAAVVASLIAPLVRSQLLVLIVGAVAAAALFWFTGEGGGRLRRNWSRWHWTGFIVLAVCIATVLDLVVAHYSRVWSVATEHYPGHMLTYGLRSAGALTIGVGILPVIAGLAALVSPRSRPHSRERRAFTSLAAAMFVSFGLYAAAKAVYVSTTFFLTEFVERNLIYLAPLLFVGTAVVLNRRRPSLPALFVATVLVLYLVTTTPYHMDIAVFFDAPGLAVLPGLHRAFGLPSTGAKPLLIALTLASTALLLFLRFASPRAAATIAVMTAAFVLSWNAFGEISFARSAHQAASSLLVTMPRPLDWVDRAVPNGAQVYYIGQSTDDAATCSSSSSGTARSSMSGAQTGPRPCRGRPWFRGSCRRTADSTRPPASSTWSPTPASRPWGACSSARFTAARAARERGRWFASRRRCACASRSRACIRTAGASRSRLSTSTRVHMLPRAPSGCMSSGPARRGATRLLFASGSDHWR